MAKQSEEMKNVNKYMRMLESAASQKEAYKSFGFASNILRGMYVKQVEAINSKEKT